MPRALFILLLLAACESPPPPNIVLIMADDLGYEALGINGGLSYETPHLDSLARAGARFTHAFSTPLCTPSRVQIMTGRYSFRNYIGFGLLDPAERTFAHLLREAGYATAIAGKWQLYGNALQQRLAGRSGSDPDDAGFDEFALWQVRERGLRFKAPTIHFSGQEPAQYPEGYGPDMFAAYIEDFIERNRERPFFLYYPMVLTHSPFQPTPGHPEYDALDPAAGVDDLAYFGSNVAYMDAIVGRLAEALRRLELDRRTLLIFTADNGTDRRVSSMHESGTIHGRKGYPTAAGTRVPLIAYWPGTIMPGLESDALVDFTDFLPTFLDVAGAEMPEDAVADGVSFLGPMTGASEGVRNWIYCHYDPRWGSFSPGRWVQDHEWKLYADGRFINWARDADEMVALPDSVLGPEAVRVKSEFQQVLDSMPPVDP